MAEIRFVTWNLNWMSRSEHACRRRAQFLADLEWDVLALQEVVPLQAEALADACVGEVVCYPGDLRGERFASALIARNGVTLTRPGLIAGLPQPRRGIFATANLGDTSFEVLSWHAPNAAKKENRLVKRQGYAAFTEWLNGRSGALLVGADANHGAVYTREQDVLGSPFLPVNDDEWSIENTFWTDPEPDMRDAWLHHLSANPEVLESCLTEHGGLPSAVSYVRGSKTNPVPDRFDYVLASPEFEIVDVRYDYALGVENSSDHAVLTARVAL